MKRRIARVGRAGRRRQRYKWRRHGGTDLREEHITRVRSCSFLTSSAMNFVTGFDNLLLFYLALAWLPLSKICTLLSHLGIPPPALHKSRRTSERVCECAVMSLKSWMLLQYLLPKCPPSLPLPCYHCRTTLCQMAHGRGRASDGRTDAGDIVV